MRNLLGLDSLSARWNLDWRPPAPELHHQRHGNTKMINPCAEISAAANMDQRKFAAISMQARGRDLSTSTSAYGVTGGAVVFTELKPSRLNLCLADGQLTPPVHRHAKLRTPKLDPASITPHLIHDKSVIHGFVLGHSVE